MSLVFNEDLTEGKYISFAKAEKQNPSSWVYNVQSNDGYPLGTIKWYAQWRKYGFYPENGTVYENICLREIAEFCIMLNARQRAGIKPQTLLLSDKLESKSA